eukprot:Seg5348.1 transcript_id=Seg5348.1/GoldUCD/mRNA.D3Y31 product="hypothetical protein" protein_id=Seg5348.1/GoldUCD/D3Y31
MIDGIIAPVVYCLFDRNLRKAVARKQSHNKARRSTAESVFKSRSGTTDSALCSSNRRRSSVNSAEGSPEQTDKYAAPCSNRLLLPQKSWPGLTDSSHDTKHGCKKAASDASQNCISGSKSRRLLNRRPGSKISSPELVQSEAYELKIGDSAIECAQSVSQELQLLGEGTSV